MEHIFEQLINNFDFAYMLSINILTYIVIKILDYFNGNNKVSILEKRIALIACIVIVTTLYVLCDYSNKAILVNSAIVTPISWSWIFKPLFNKFGIGYK